MPVVKNLMVRVGANTSSFTSEMRKAAQGTKDFGSMVHNTMNGKVAESMKAFDVDYIGDQIKKVKKDLKAMMQEKDNMAAAGVSPNDGAYQELVINIHSVRDELRGLLEDQAALSATPADVSAVDEMVAHIRELESAAADCGNVFKQLSMLNEIKQANQSLSGMMSPGNASLPIGQQLNEAKAALKEMETAGLGAGDAAWDDMYVQVQDLTRAVKDYKASLEAVPTSIWNRMGSAAKTAFSKISTGARGVKRVLTSVGHGIKSVGGFLGKIGGAGVSGIKKVAGWIGSIGSRARGSSSGVSGLGSVLKKVGVAAIGLKLASAMFGRLRSIVSGYISENATLQAQVDSLKTSMGQALAPAINVVTNALSVLMPYIVGVSNAIGSLIANVFGTGWSTVASGAKAAAAATSGAAAAQEEYNRTIAGFDEITKLDSSSGGGGGGGGGSGGGSDVSSTVIEGVLPNWLTDLSTKIKEAIAADDFTAVGTILADQLGVAVDYASRLINSSEFRQKILGIVSAVTAGINGFFAELTASTEEKSSIAENIGTLIGDAVTFALGTIDRIFNNIDFGTIGVALAQAVNGTIESMNSSSFSFGTTLGNMLQSGVEYAAGVIDTLDWAGLGSLLAKNVTGFMDSIDWAGAGTTLSNGVRGALNTITTAIQEVDWYKMGESIKEFIVNIDWAGVVSDLAKAFGAACGGLGALIGGLIGDAVAGAKDYFTDKIEEAGGNVVAGIFNGIKEGMANIGKWIKENIFDPLVEGFKSTFRIASPSKDPTILGIGGYITEGLLNGMLEPFRAIDAWVQTNIRDPLANALENVFGDNFLSDFLRGGDDDSAVGADADVTIAVTGVKDEIPPLDKRLDGFTATLNSYADRTNQRKTTGAVADIRQYVDNTNPGKLTPATMKATAFMDFTSSSKLTPVRAKSMSFVDATPSDKLVNVRAKATSFQNALQTPTLTAKLNMKKNWSGSLESAMGISNLTSTLNVKTPTIKVDWKTSTYNGYSTRYPSYKAVLYAKGGILNDPTLLGFTGNAAHIAGEAGREAILPLDRNTEWMDKIAQRVVSLMPGSANDRPVEITVQVPLDGKVIGQTVVRWANGQARATGKHPMAAYI